VKLLNSFALPKFYPDEMLNQRCSGTGATAWLQCPTASHARIPKKTLSFETGSVAELTDSVAPYLAASATNCQSLAAVSRQTI
jgi:hypothetical protein